MGIWDIYANNGSLIFPLPRRAQRSRCSRPLSAHRCLHTAPEQISKKKQWSILYNPLQFKSQWAIYHSCILSSESSCITWDHVPTTNRSAAPESERTSIVLLASGEKEVASITKSRTHQLHHVTAEAELFAGLTEGPMWDPRCCGRSRLRSVLLHLKEAPSSKASGRQGFQGGVQVADHETPSEDLCRRCRQLKSFGRPT